MAHNSAAPLVKKTGGYISVDPDKALRRLEPDIRSLIADFQAAVLRGYPTPKQKPEGEEKPETEESAKEVAAVAK